MFANLSVRADQVAKEEFERLRALPAGEGDEGDLGSLAEVAQEKGEMYYNALDTLHKTSLTLYTIGLFHLLEQQLAAACHDTLFDGKPPTDTKLDITVTWLKKNLGLDIKTLPSWGAVDELRLLANSAKHGKGSSAKQLRALRPELFEDPQLRELMPEHPDIYTPSKVHTPITGQGIYVSEHDFSAFGRSAFEFSIEIAQHFESKSNECFFAGG